MTGVFFCPSCGASFDPQVQRFCEQCGFDLSSLGKPESAPAAAPPAPAAPQAPTAPPPGPPEADRAPLWPWIVGSLIVLGTVVAVLVIVFVGGGDDGASAATTTASLATTAAPPTTEAPATTAAPATTEAPVTTAATTTTAATPEERCGGAGGVWLAAEAGGTCAAAGSGPTGEFSVIRVEIDDPDGGLLVWDGPGAPGSNVPQEDKYRITGVLPPFATGVRATGHATADGLWYYIEYPAGGFRGWARSSFLGMWPEPRACEGGWIRPDDWTALMRDPLHELRRFYDELDDEDLFIVDEMRYFRGSSPRLGLPSVEFWYFVGYQEFDAAFRARWLIVRTADDIEVYGVAPYGSQGFAPGTWAEFHGTGASFTWPGLPGSYRGVVGDPFDPGSELPVVGGDVFACLAG